MIKFAGILVAVAGAAIVFIFPLPGNLIGLPITLIGIIMVIIPSGGQNWRNL